jgi:hypothetical protein
MKECDNSTRKTHISMNFILSISLLIMFDTLLLRPSLHCNAPLHFITLHPSPVHYTSPHFTTLHPTTLHYTYRHFTSWKIILESRTGNVIISEVDALMYVVLSNAEKHVPNGVLVDTTECVTL